MKKNFFRLLSIVIIFILILCVLNIGVTTKQGINYRVSEIKLPIYLKILDFVDRHYNYKNLVKNILGDTKDEPAKVIKIFNWVTANLNKNPKELPIIDDHPLNILIRGYGVADQFEDIFTILCTYAGMDSFFKSFNNHSGGAYYISFVKIQGKWCPLSAFEGVYLTKNGAIVSVNDILLDKSILFPFALKLANFESDTFVKEIGNIDFEADWPLRTKGQSPIGRILYSIKNMLSFD